MNNTLLNSDRAPFQPSKVSSAQKKEEVQNLNDRLFAYITTVHRLESENKQLRSIISQHDEVTSSEILEIKKMYEKELDASKKLIDELAKNGSKHETEMCKMKTDFAETLSKLTKANQNEVRTIQNRVNITEVKLKEAEDKIKKMSDDHAKEIKIKQDEVFKTQKDLDRVFLEYQQLYDTKKELDKEITKYHSLMDSEEKRLKMTQQKIVYPKSKSSAPAMAGNCKKRKMSDVNDDDDDAANNNKVPILMNSTVSKIFGFWKS